MSSISFLKGRLLSKRPAALSFILAAIVAVLVLVAPGAASAVEPQSATIDMPDSVMKGHELTVVVTFHFDYYPEDQEERQRATTKVMFDHNVPCDGDYSCSSRWDGNDYVFNLVFGIPGDTTATGFDISAMFLQTELAVKSGQIIDCDHAETVTDPAIDPTCTGQGKTAGERCTICGAVLVAQEEIPAKGHVKGSTVRENETVAGYDEVVYCEVCGDEVSRTHIAVPAAGDSSAMLVIALSAAVLGSLCVLAGCASGRRTRRRRCSRL